MDSPDRKVVQLIVNEDEAINFSGSSNIGFLFQTACSKDENLDFSDTINVASYYAGVIAKKLETKHLQVSGISMRDCNTCKYVFTDEVTNQNLFSSLKEYEREDFSELTLNICSKNFVRIVIVMERIVLYFLHNFIHLYGFIPSLKLMISNHVPDNLFCCSAMVEFFINFYVKSRCYQSEKQLNSHFIKKPKSTDKMRTFQHT